jgi:hypothetical protein
MRLSIAALGSYAGLLTSVNANFDVYMVDAYSRIQNTHQRAWQVFAAEPSSCNEVALKPYWFSGSDVSGTNEGVRCAGNGCDYTASITDIDTLEMNFHGTNPVYHWSEYIPGWNLSQS